MELIRLENITKTYHVGEIDLPVLKGVSLSIERGEYVALMGASGSGKTTLMNLLGCLDRPTSGRYWLDGVELSQISADERANVRNRQIGFVFQSFNLLARTSALENVLLPLEYAAEHPAEQERSARARELLERVGLADRLEHVPSQMSGGQQQRVAIARSLINRPVLLLADEPTGNLDSRTSAEIMEMFDRLHEEGMTIVLVTHDPEVAARAERVVRLRDGLVAGDERQRPRHPPPQAMAAHDLVPAAPHPIAARRGGRFPVPRTLRTALGAILRNKMRSALTIKGIIIGVAAVISMMEIGQGSKTAIAQTIASMGANNLIVMSGAASSGGVTFGSGSVLTLTPQDAETIQKQAPAVSHVAPIVRSRTQVVYGNRNWVPVFIYGTIPEFLQVRDWEDLEDGEMFLDRDVRQGTKVCVVGQTIVRELFQGESPIGAEIRVKNVSLRVIGVLPRKGANMMGMDQDDIIITPWTTLKYRVSGQQLADTNQSTAARTDTAEQVNTLNELYPGSSPLYPVPSPLQLADTPQPVRFTNIDQIHIKAASAEEVPQAIQQINTILRERHHLRAGQPDDFNIRDMTEQTRTLASTSDLMGGLLLAVALISLVVGGVGIMNIMLVSVTERTREIGLRMAVGAAAGKILTQFLVEAIVLCLLGGAFGIAVGRGTSFLVTAVLQWPTEPSLAAAAAAVIVSITVGVVFGFYPAWKASRLDPIAALRYE